MNYIIETEEKLGFITLLDFHTINQIKDVQQGTVIIIKSYFDF